MSGSSRLADGSAERAATEPSTCSDMGTYASSPPLKSSTATSQIPEGCAGAGASSERLGKRRSISRPDEHSTETAMRCAARPRGSRRWIREARRQPRPHCSSMTPSLTPSSSSLSSLSASEPVPPTGTDGVALAASSARNAVAWTAAAAPPERLAGCSTPPGVPAVSRATSSTLAQSAWRGSAKRLRPRLHAMPWSRVQARRSGAQKCEEVAGWWGSQRSQASSSGSA
mmetsp:Transcript_1881/g.4981  ORF Transcript_1881/g.4981 Transcript_1881/m.4981 type:complete len:228 (-) Transcript_1881:16-699(-)